MSQIDTELQRRQKQRRSIQQMDTLIRQLHIPVGQPRKPIVQANTNPVLEEKSFDFSDFKSGSNNSDVKSINSGKEGQSEGKGRGEGNRSEKGKEEGRKGQKESKEGSEKKSGKGIGTIDEWINQSKMMFSKSKSKEEIKSVKVLRVVERKDVVSGSAEDINFSDFGDHMSSNLQGSMSFFKNGEKPANEVFSSQVKPTLNEPKEKSKHDLSDFMSVKSDHENEPSMHMEKQDFFGGFGGSGIKAGSDIKAVPKEAPKQVPKEKSVKDHNLSDFKSVGSNKSAKSGASGNIGNIGNIGKVESKREEGINFSDFGDHMSSNLQGSMSFFKNGEKPANEVFSSQVKPTLNEPKEKSKHDLSDFMSVKSDHENEPSMHMEKQDFFGGFGGSGIKAGSDIKAVPKEAPKQVPKEKSVKDHNLSDFKSVGSNKSAKSGASGNIGNIGNIGKVESKREEGINFSDFGDHMSSNLQGSMSFFKNGEKPANEVFSSQVKPTLNEPKEKSKHDLSDFMSVKSDHENEPSMHMEKQDFFGGFGGSGIKAGSDIKAVPKEAPKQVPKEKSVKDHNLSDFKSVGSNKSAKSGASGNIGNIGNIGKVESKREEGINFSDFGDHMSSNLQGSMSFFKNGEKPANEVFSSQVKPTLNEPKEKSKHDLSDFMSVKSDHENEPSMHMEKQDFFGGFGGSGIKAGSDIKAVPKEAPKQVPKEKSVKDHNLSDFKSVGSNKSAKSGASGNIGNIGNIGKVESKREEGINFSDFGDHMSSNLQGSMSFFKNGEKPANEVFSSQVKPTLNEPKEKSKHDLSDFMSVKSDHENEPSMHMEKQDFFGGFGGSGIKAGSDIKAVPKEAPKQVPKEKSVKDHNLSDFKSVGSNKSAKSGASGNIGNIGNIGKVESKREEGINFSDFGDHMSSNLQGSMSFFKNGEKPANEVFSSQVKPTLNEPKEKSKHDLSDFMSVKSDHENEPSMHMEKQDFFGGFGGSGIKAGSDIKAVPKEAPKQVPKEKSVKDHNLSDFKSVGSNKSAKSGASGNIGNIGNIGKVESKREEGINFSDFGDHMSSNLQGSMSFFKNGEKPANEVFSSQVKPTLNEPKEKSKHDLSDFMSVKSDHENEPSMHMEKQDFFGGFGGSGIKAGSDIKAVPKEAPKQVPKEKSVKDHNLSDFKSVGSNKSAKSGASGNIGNIGNIGKVESKREEGINFSDFGDHMSSNLQGSMSFFKNGEKPANEVFSSQVKPTLNEPKEKSKHDLSDFMSVKSDHENEPSMHMEKQDFFGGFGGSGIKAGSDIKAVPKEAPKQVPKEKSVKDHNLSDFKSVGSNKSAKSGASGNIGNIGNIGKVESKREEGINFSDFGDHMSSNLQGSMSFFKNGEKPANEVFSSQVKPTLNEPKEKSKHDLSDFMSVKSDHENEPSMHMEKQDFFGGFGGSGIKAGSDIKAVPKEAPKQVPKEKSVKDHNLSDFKSVGSNKSAKSGASGNIGNIGNIGKVESKREEGINFSDFGDHMSSNLQGSMSFFKNGEKPANEVFSSQVKPTLNEPKEKSKHDLSDFMSVKSDHENEPSMHMEKQDFFGGFGGSGIKAGSDIKAVPKEAPKQVPKEKSVKDHNLSDFKSVGSNKSAKSGASGNIGNIGNIGKVESKREEGINFSDFGDHISSNLQASSHFQNQQQNTSDFKSVHSNKSKSSQSQPHQSPPPTPPQPQPAVNLSDFHSVHSHPQIQKSISKIHPQQPNPSKLPQLKQSDQPNLSDFASAHSASNSMQPSVVIPLPPPIEEQMLTDSVCATPLYFEPRQFGHKHEEFLQDLPSFHSDHIEQKSVDHSLSDIVEHISEPFKSQQMSLKHFSSKMMGEPQPLPALDIHNISDIPLASSKQLCLQRPPQNPKPMTPLQPITSTPQLPSLNSGRSIDLEHRLLQIAESLPQQLNQAFSAVSTFREQDKMMYEQFAALRGLVEQCVKKEKEEASRREDEGKSVLENREDGEGMAARLMARLDDLAKMICEVVERRKEEKRNQEYSPLVVSRKIQSQDPAEGFLKPEKEAVPKPEPVNRVQKYPLFFNGEQHGTVASYSKLFEQAAGEPKTIYKSGYLQIVSRYTILDNYDKGKLLKIQLKYTNTDQSYLRQLSVTLKSKQPIIAKPQRLDLAHLPPQSTLIQQIYLPRFNEGDYFIELTAEVKTEKFGKRRVTVPVARDISKFLEVVRVQGLEDGFVGELARQQQQGMLEVKGVLDRFNFVAMPMKRVIDSVMEINSMQYVGAFRLINRTSLFFVKIERVQKQGYHATILSDPSDSKLSNKLLQYLSFLHTSC